MKFSRCCWNKKQKNEKSQKMNRAGHSDYTNKHSDTVILELACAEGVVVVVVVCAKIPNPRYVALLRVVGRVDGNSAFSNTRNKEDTF
jgi:hypothetical protein